jgi:hypothetical protein
MSLFTKFSRLPPHWKALLGGQAIITVGLMIHRMSYIHDVKSGKPNTNERRLMEKRDPNNGN